MPLQTERPTTYTAQQILNLAFVAATSRLATNTDTGDGGGMTYTEQEIWNRIFDRTNSVVNLSMS